MRDPGNEVALPEQEADDILTSLCNVEDHG